MVNQWLFPSARTVDSQSVGTNMTRSQGSPSRRAAGTRRFCFVLSAVFGLISGCPPGRDQTRTGHILGDPARRSEAPERRLTSAQSAVLRLLTHLAMLQGAVTNHRVRLLPLTRYLHWEAVLYEDDNQ